jgi:hypothetical protein
METGTATENENSAFVATKNRLERRREAKLGIRATVLQAMAISEQARRESMTLHNRVLRSRNPWDMVQLTKAERRGKTPEEIETARKIKWARESDADIEALR